jgi:hypothetical protein
MIYLTAATLKHIYGAPCQLKEDALPVGNAQVWDLNAVWPGVINS